MRRGEIWWAELAGGAGYRPVAVVSRSDALSRRVNVTIAEVTRAIRSLPSEVPLSVREGMPTECVINTDNLHTIPRERLRQLIVMLSDEHLFRLAQALRYSLELDW